MAPGTIPFFPSSEVGLGGKKSVSEKQRNQISRLLEASDVGIQTEFNSSLGIVLIFSHKLNLNSRLQFQSLDLDSKQPISNIAV